MLKTIPNQISSRPARPEDIVLMKQMLKAEDLPTSDLVLDIVQLYVFFIDDKILGFSGLENFKDSGLLRSIVVAEELKGNGYGKEIVAKTIEMAKEAYSVEHLYLFTEKAAGFFRKFGFQTMPRNLAPAFIKQTKQFSELCPDSATFMHKRLV